jgi:hypothetical protein
MPHPPAPRACTWRGAPPTHPTACHITAPLPPSFVCPCKHAAAHPSYMRPIPLTLRESAYAKARAGRCCVCGLFLTCSSPCCPRAPCGPRCGRRRWCQHVGEHKDGQAANNVVPLLPPHPTPQRDMSERAIHTHERVHTHTHTPVCPHTYFCTNDGSSTGLSPGPPPPPRAGATAGTRPGRGPSSAAVTVTVVAN